MGRHQAAGKGARDRHLVELPAPEVVLQVGTQPQRHHAHDGPAGRLPREKITAAPQEKPRGEQIGGRQLDPDGGPVAKIGAGQQPPRGEQQNHRGHAEINVIPAVVVSRVMGPRDALRPGPRVGQPGQPRIRLELQVGLPGHDRLRQQLVIGVRLARHPGPAGALRGVGVPAQHHHHHAADQPPFQAARRGWWLRGGRHGGRRHGFICRRAGSCARNKSRREKPGPRWTGPAGCAPRPPGRL